MALGNLREATAGFYVGLSKDASIVEVYRDLEQDTLATTDPRVVSIGYLMVQIVDYEESFSIGAGLEHDPEDCKECDTDHEETTP